MLIRIVLLAVVLLWSGEASAEKILLNQSGGGVKELGGVDDAAKVTQATLLAGEDQTNNVIRVEGQFLYAVDDADLVVKAAPGFVHTFTCWPEDAAATAGSVELRDATAAGGGTVVYREEFAAALYPGKTITLDAIFATGIVIDFTTTADVMCTVTYR